VEEHYYLIWPTIVRWAGMRSVAYTATIICILEPAIRAFSLHYAGSGGIYVFSCFRLDGLAIGSLIACFVRSAWYSPRLVGISVAILVAVAAILRFAGARHGILAHDTPFGAALEFVPGNLFFGAAILYSVAHTGSAQTAILRNRFLRVAADLSYCLYLIHFLVINAYDAIIIRLSLPGPASSFAAIVIRAFIVLVACFVLAEISRTVLEIPALRLKRYFVTGAQKTAQTA
jgi:peptidoglycan/LPS O-acetylase OafA/YrhL